MPTRLPALMTALVLTLPAPALAGLLDSRAGGPARPATTGMSFGAVADYFAIGEANTMGLMVDAQLPVGMPLRARLPLAVTGSEHLDEAGLGNVVVGTAKGLELGVAALVLGVDVAMPTNRSKAVSLHPMRAAEYAPKTTSVIPHATLGLDTPIFDARAHADVVYAALVDESEAGESALLRLGAVVGVSFFPLAQLSLAVDALQDLKGDGDMRILAAPGLRASLPPLVDLGLSVPIVVSGAQGEDMNFGVTFDVSVGL